MDWQCIKAGLLALALLASNAATGADDSAVVAMELTPPRLSYTEGRVSFWRQGAEDWAPARVNTPLAEGDARYTGERATAEIQVGARAFVRAREKTRFGLGNAVYAPAPVAFFGLGHDVSVRVGIGLPAVGWVALGWGEPLRPWWGRPGFIGAPWWGG